MMNEQQQTEAELSDALASLEEAMRVLKIMVESKETKYSEKEEAIKFLKTVGYLKNK